MMRRKQNVGRKLAIGAAISGVLGYAAGILTAPKSGKQTRDELTKKAGEVKGGAEAQLQDVLGELNTTLKSAQTKSKVMSAKGREEFNETVVKAKDAQNKASQVLKAFKAGEAENPELNKAVKQAKQAVTNLRKYLKS